MGRQLRAVGAGEKSGLPRKPREYSFREFLPAYGPEFVADWAAAWDKAFALENPVSTDKWYQAVRRFLATVAILEGASGPATDLIQQLRQGSANIEEATLGATLRQVAALAGDMNDRLLFADVQMRTRANFVHMLNAALKRLANIGFLPGCRGAAVRWRSYGDRHVPSLAELGKSGREAIYVPSGVSLEEHSVAVAKLASDRLEALRGRLESEFLTEAARFDQGRAWLLRSDLPSGRDIENLLKRGGPRYRPRRIIAPLLAEIRRSHPISDADLPALPVRWLAALWRRSQVKRTERA